MSTSQPRRQTGGNAAICSQEPRETPKTRQKAPGATPRKASALETHLARSMEAAGLPKPEREYVFHPERKWRLDFCWPDAMLAVEVEGGIYRGGGHTSAGGIKRDIDKHNALTLLGWRVLRFHGDQVRSGEATETIRRALTAADRSAGATG